MPREYGLDPYGIVARGNSMYGGSTSPFSSIAPTFRGGMPGIKFRTAFAEGGYADGGMATSLPFMGSTPPPPRGNPYGGMDKDQRKSLNEMRRNYGINQPMPTQPGFPSMLPRDPGYGGGYSPNPMMGGGGPDLPSGNYTPDQMQLMQNMFNTVQTLPQDQRLAYLDSMHGTQTGMTGGPNSQLPDWAKTIPMTGNNNIVYDPATQTIKIGTLNNSPSSPDFMKVTYGDPMTQSDVSTRYANTGYAMPVNSMPLAGTDQAYQDFLGQQSYAPQVMQMQPDGTRPYGMGGPTPYTIGQPAGQMGGMPQPTQPAMMPQAQRPGQMMRDQRQDQQQMQQPMQGGQMMNRPFAVRGR